MVITGWQMISVRTKKVVIRTEIENSMFKGMSQKEHEVEAFF